MRFFSRQKEEKPEKPIDNNYYLKITFKRASGKKDVAFSNPQLKNLSKVYFWFLLRNSEKYNLRYRNGQIIIQRHEISTMELFKGINNFVPYLYKGE